MNSADYATHDSLALAALIRAREVSRLEVVNAAIERIEALNPGLNAAEQTSHVARRVYQVQPLVQFTMALDGVLSTHCALTDPCAYRSPGYVSARARPIARPTQARNRTRGIFMITKFGAAAALSLATSLAAQVIVPASNAPVVVSGAQNVTVVPQQLTGDVLRAGAPIPVVLSEPLTTKGKSLKVGQRVRLEVAQDVMVNGRLVIPARSPVEGVLTEVRNKGMWGKSGGIKLKISSVNINGTNIRLTGEMDDRGDTGTAGVVGAVVAFPLAGFFVTGTSAEMPLNMPGRAFLDQDIALAPVKQ